MRENWRPDGMLLTPYDPTIKEQLSAIINEAGCSLKFGNGQGYKKGELVEAMAKHFAHVLTLEAPSADELKAMFWIPEAMQFPAIDPDMKNETPSHDEDEGEKLAA
ncbi:MAG: hypothetical protein CMH26_08415 [Micavibrio sp.]|nr:hypothetical protein [Micavibrio sp.]|tara:strand:- start:1394 stop:1711 length:318 start_codon:yes stop_codon:yes gene_type:complete